MDIVIRDTGRVAFTAYNLPGVTAKAGASRKQLTQRANAMNERAKSMGIETRYTVK